MTAKSGQSKTAGLPAAGKTFFLVPTFKSTDSGILTNDVPEPVHPKQVRLFVPRVIPDVVT